MEPETRAAADVQPDGSKRGRICDGCRVPRLYDGAQNRPGQLKDLGAFPSDQRILTDEEPGGA